MVKWLTATLSAATAFVVYSGSPAVAAVIWDGDASGGTSVFGTVECPAPSSLVTAASTTGHGTIFRYTKVSGQTRCESRGIRVSGSRYGFSEGRTYWLGWESQLSTVSGDFVVWQWKSYPNATQNYPLIMTVKNGEIRLFYVGPNATSWTRLWSANIAAGSWNRFALGLHTSTSTTGGWVELYFNGTRQYLLGSTRYAGRTWDSANEPKWGVYDSDDGSTELINRIDSLKLGTTYTDVAAG